LTNEKGESLQQNKFFQVDLSEEIDKHIIRALKLDYLPEIKIMDGFLSDRLVLSY